MGKLEKASTTLAILVMLEGLYDRWATRRRNREVFEKDAKIRELEVELAKLKEAR